MPKRNKIKKMIYSDLVYGKVKIIEPALLDLIKCHSIQRLKGIDQAGYPKPWFHAKPRNRFEHSMGVFILLKKYGAPIEEQIAGLIHDVSHLSFSHAIDYVLGEKEQEKRLDFQDNLFDEYVRNSDIPKILRKHGFDLDYILNEKNFPLKENELPDICADRIDYFLRDIFGFKFISKKTLKEFLDNLIEIDKTYWVFKNYKTAREFAEKFMKFDDEYYSGNSTALMFLTVSEYLKYALKKHYVSKRDFYLTDREVLDKISSHHAKDKHLVVLFNRMNNKVGYKISRNSFFNFDFHLFCKSRAVDPLCKHANNVKQVSEIDPDFGEKLKDYLNPKEYFIKFDN